MGNLIPIGFTEVLPGDSIQQATNALIRTNPLVAPVMHPVHVKIHHWYVPLRLIWDDFEKFITGGPDGMDATVYPTLTTPATTGFTESSLADYLGIPPGVASKSVSALPFRAYAKIFNENYRDQDLVSPLAISTASGVDSTTSVALALAAWEKDYFTTARPWTQKGPSVTLPLGTEAPLKGKSNIGGAVDNRIYFRSENAGQTGYLASGVPNSANSSTVLGVSSASIPNNSAYNFQQEGEGGTNVYGGYSYADLSEASAVDINQVRLAFAIQRYEEARARYGSRYTEYLRYLGVRSSDARLDRPEYLGGGKQTIQFSEVLATSASEEDPLGTMGGHGIGALRSNRFRRFFEEHGYIMTVMSVRPKTMYASGLHRTWNRRTKEDFWQKELEHIGQQELLNKELYFGAAGTTGDDPFGYQDRYDEYRHAESSIAGQMRTTLNYWNMARIFAATPTLNGTFVSCDPSMRNFVDQVGDPLIVMANHSIQARRIIAATGSSFIY